jgi:hypothetical protein
MIRVQNKRKDWLMLKRLSWGWLIIGWAYVVAVLPMSPQHHAVWLWVSVMLAYLVLAGRTIDMALRVNQNASSDPSARRKVYWACLINPALLLLPMLSLVLTHRTIMSLRSEFCLPYAVCASDSVIYLPFALLGIGLIVVVLLLDHALLISMALMLRRHLQASTGLLRNMALFLRISLTCFMTCASVILANIWSKAFLDAPPVLNLNGYAIEGQYLVYPAIEPLLTDGVFLSATFLAWKPAPCEIYGADRSICLVRRADTLPHFLVTMVVGILIYLGTIMGVLLLALYRPEKPKRKPHNHPEATDRQPIGGQASGRMNANGG